MNRKWLLGGVAALLATAAVLALVVGGVVGRTILPEPAPAPERRPPTVRFTDTLTDVSIAYPTSWARRISRDQAVRLVAAAPDGAASVSLSVRKSNLDRVTEETLGIVRPLTDDLLRQDVRIREIGEPVGVRVGGVPGYRYTYTYRKGDGSDGAHIHYFLFEGSRLIQIVLQAVPAVRLQALQPTFDAVASTFRTTRG